MSSSSSSHHSLCDLCAREYGVCQYEVSNNACKGFLSPEELKKKLNNGHGVYPKKQVQIYKYAGIISPIIAIILFIWSLANGVFSRENKLLSTIETRVEVEKHIINQGTFKHFTDEQVRDLNESIWALAYQVQLLNIEKGNNQTDIIKKRKENK